MNTVVHHGTLRCVSARSQGEFIEPCYACCKGEEENTFTHPLIGSIFIQEGGSGVCQHILDRHVSYTTERKATMYRRRVIGLLLLGLLTIVLVACGGGGASTPTNPTVRLDATRFLQDSITIKKGESLTFINERASPHVIANGTWEDEAEQPGAESGAPTVNLNIPAHGSATTPPFETAGTFKLYCPIHMNMNLTVIVE
jgi:plastocyanin